MIYEYLIEKLDGLVEKNFLPDMVEGDKDLTGLDSRVRIFGIWYDDDTLILNASLGTLNFYAGFEYIDVDYKMVIGNYIILPIYDDEGEEIERIADIVNSLKEGTK